MDQGKAGLFTGTMQAQSLVHTEITMPATKFPRASIPASPDLCPSRRRRQAWVARLSLLLGLVLAAAVQAREVTITTQLNNYRGQGAYLAIYLIDASGSYVRTLWIAGDTTKYYKHLADWARGSKQKRTEYDGMTGASVESSESLTITAHIDDAFIDAGYVIRVDSVVEEQRENRADASIPLTTEGAGKPVAGRVYVRSLRYSL